MATATLKKSKPVPPRKHRKSQHPSTTTSITRWFRAASQVGKLFLPQRAGCPPGQPFPFAHQSPLSPLSFVYRLSASALSRGLGGQAYTIVVLRAGACRPSELTAPHQGCRSCSVCLSDYHCFGRVS